MTTPPRVIIFGGNARISQLMTTLMLERSWSVVSVIRDARQEKRIQRLGEDGQKGQLEVIVHDLEDIKSVGDAENILNHAKPSAVVFAAGSMSNPFGVDRDAAKRVMKASIDDRSSVNKFLFISFPSARRKRAPWWSDKDYSDYRAEKSSYPDTWQAKLEADEYLVALAEARARRGGAPFQAISLRPTWLTNSKGTGHVQLGKAGCVGTVTREDIAAVAVSLLSRDDTRGWLDLFQGSVEIEDAVDRVVRDSINSIDGEDLDHIYKLAD